MNYVYHFVPDNMQGRVLYPLSMIKDIYPDIFEAHIKKYESRTKLTELIIPELDCKWNDVLFFSTVHPGKIKDFIGEFGYGNRINWQFYQIPIEDLDLSKVCIWLGDGSNYKEKYEKFSCIPYDRDTFYKYSEMSEYNKKYLTETLSQSGQPFHMFAGAVHVLYKGSIDVSKYSIISIEK